MEPTPTNRGHKAELMIFVAAFSAFLATFNETFLNVAFTHIMADLNVNIGTVQWLSTAYMLGAAVMVPISAFLYRSLPTKHLYLITVGLLVIGSAVCGLAGNFKILLLGRIIQALGTGMLIPIGMNITLQAAPKRKLGAYMGLMGAMTTLGPSSSVILAGLILAIADWHTMLWFFFALTVICFICGALLLDNIAQLTYPKLDLISVLLIGFALICLLYGVSTIFSGSLKLAPSLIILGFILLLLFIWRQNNLAQPLINLRPLLVKPFAVGVVLNMLSLIIIFAMNIVTPMFLQAGWQTTPLAASLALFPAIMLSCVVSPLAGRIYDKHGARLLLPLGFIFMALAAFGIMLIQHLGSRLLLALLYIPIICGSSLIIGPVQSLALSALNQEQNPHGVTIMSTGFQIAGCLGVSVFAGVYGLYPDASAGFNSVNLLAAGLAIVGLLLAFAENSLCKQKQVQPVVANSNTVAAIMNTQPYSISDKATALQALSYMAEKKTSGLPICDAHNRLTGFISDGDIIRYMGGTITEPNTIASAYPLWHNMDRLDERLGSLSQLPVNELATQKVVCIDQNAQLKEIFQVFSDKRIKKIPVLNGQKLVGVISRSDLLRRLVNDSLSKQA